MNETTNVIEAELENVMCQAIPLLRQAVEYSVELRKADNDAYIAAWEEFLSGFLKHVQSIDSQQGGSLLADIRMSKILSN